ncbi:MAG: riboflavin biosynthesis protein RibF [Verrucomicrobia bacterium]|nr:riboflavin biosynthesis protein RibF [Verrucomicrobiota bacterium]
MSQSRPLHLAIGAFDGVHLGHRAVLHSARTAARLDGGLVGVLTYDPHPSKVLRPDAPVPLIFNRSQKDERLTEAGAQMIHHEKFDRHHAAIDAADFPTWLQKSFPHLKSLHVGSNFQYGRGRTGNGESLIAHGAQAGLNVRLVAAVHLGSETVSSSRIRQCLAEGELDLANAMLLRPYEAEGTIIGGRRLGRTISFPTVNVAWEPELKPAFGVYAVEVIFKGEALPAVANYGIRPTSRPCRRKSQKIPERPSRYWAYWASRERYSAGTRDSISAWRSAGAPSVSTLPVAFRSSPSKVKRRAKSMASLATAAEPFGPSRRIRTLSSRSSLR